MLHCFDLWRYQKSLTTWKPYYVFRIVKTVVLNFIHSQLNFLINDTYQDNP